jgi:predicted  nucleic acid-binding Zn-ribbon protein
MRGAFKVVMNKSLKEIQEHKIKQVKRMNKTIQDLKMEIEAIKKTQTKEILEIENLGRKTVNIDSRITNRIQEMEDSISGIDDMMTEDTRRKTTTQRG